MTNFAEFEKVNTPQETADQTKSESALETKENTREQIAKESEKLKINVALMDAGLTDLNKQAETGTSDESKMTCEEKIKKIQEDYERGKSESNAIPFVGALMSIFSGLMMVSQGGIGSPKEALLMGGAIAGTMTAGSIGLWAFARLGEFLKFNKQSKAVEKEGK